MRPFLLALLVSVAAIPACKARQPGAQVRDTGDEAPAPSGDLGAQLSDLATGMEADLSTYTAGVFVPRDTAAALDDNKPRARTKDELDALRKAAADAAAEYKLAQAETDKLDAERVAALARLRDKLTRTNAALAQIDAADTERYSQGLDDVQKVLDEMREANKINTSVKCPTNYVAVAGDKFFGTKDFCVMKYEAKKDASNKAISAATGTFYGETALTVTQAKALCSAIGPGYALINNPEWMTLATNIAQVPGNWSGGKVGSGAVNTGNTGPSNPNKPIAAGPDNQPCINTGASCDERTWVASRRTHKLSNGQVIWDLAGNPYEFVDYVNGRNRITGTNVDLNAITNAPDMLISVVRPTHNTHPFWNDTWGKAQGMGSYNSYSNIEISPYPLRGGSFGNGFGEGSVGIFGMAMHIEATETSSAAVRCVFHPQ